MLCLVLPPITRAAIKVLLGGQVLDGGGGNESLYRFDLSARTWSAFPPGVRIVQPVFGCVTAEGHVLVFVPESMHLVSGESARACSYISNEQIQKTEILDRLIWLLTFPSHLHWI